MWINKEKISLQAINAIDKVDDIRYWIKLEHEPAAGDLVLNNKINELKRILDTLYKEINNE